MTFDPAPSPLPLIVQIVLDQKADLLAAEKGTMLDLTGSWLNMEASLSPEMDKLALEIIGKRASGEIVSLDSLLTSPNYRALAAKSRAALDAYLNTAESTIVNQQRFFAELALSNADDALHYGLAEFGLHGDFQPLPLSTIENLIGQASNGTSIRSLLDPTRLDALDGMTRYILDAANNLNITPDELVRQMQDGLAFGFNRTLNTARTESFRLYRYTQRLAWQSSLNVFRYRRVCSHDGNVCPACLMDEGTFYSVAEDMPEHPQGRCQGVPVLINHPPPDWDKGEAWFIKQDSAYQIHVLGQGRYNAWVEGKFSLNQLVQVSHDDEWGDSLNSTPLYQLTGAQ